MALVRSDQKGMEEVQRIWEALAGGRPVLSEDQMDLIRQQTIFLGEDGDAIMRIIQEDVVSAGRLPADIARVIEKCCQDLARRVALREMSNEMEKEKEPERLLQLEGLQEQVSKYAITKDKGNIADLMRVKQALPPLLKKYLEDLEADEREGLSPEAHKLISEAGEAIKTNREIIKAALRGLGAASDISEVSSLVVPPQPPPARPSMGNLAPPAWPPRGNPAAPAWPTRSNRSSLHGPRRICPTGQPRWVQETN
jgi:hypothetical protein